MIAIRDGFDQHRMNRLVHAHRGTALATARLQGMKQRGRYAKAAPPGFPYPGHRTCAEWEGPNRRGKRALKPLK